jgi:hypothetical protein
MPEPALAATVIPTRISQNGHASSPGSVNGRPMSKPKAGKVRFATRIAATSAMKPTRTDSPRN